jgi:hypothetical protein
VKKETGMEFARFLLVFRALQEAFLPQHKMNLLRSAFGAHMSRVACIMPEHHTHQPLCLFEQLFEGRGTNRPPGMDRVPPFVIECLNKADNIAAGENLQVWFTLLAPRVFWPQVQEVWHHMGQGLGRPGQNFRLERLVAMNIETDERGVIADFGRSTGQLRSVEDFIFDEVSLVRKELPDKRITLYFITPCRLEVEHRPIRQPTFLDIVLALRRRAHVLGNSWGNGCPTWASRDITDQASQVKVVESDLHWQDWSRLSGSQRQRVDMGGFTGAITISGDLRPFHPLLAFGELFHLGGGLTSGNGQYTIE